MRNEELMTVAAEALETEGAELTGADMRLSSLDLISRWSLVVALEKAVNYRAPDAQIEAAQTIGELVALYAQDDEPESAAAEQAAGPLSSDDIRAALGL